METVFDKDRTLHSVLYILSEMGGTCDMHKIFKTLYFADRKHLSKYGRSITSDRYVAMQYGPVPAKTDDIFRAVRGDSFFADCAGDLRNYIRFVNKYMIVPNMKPDMDYLSTSDVECLDESIAMTRGLSFNELTALSHDIAWSNTSRDREISIKDILREAGDSEEYVEYIADKIRIESQRI